jgi:hypothetical protein
METHPTQQRAGKSTGNREPERVAITHHTGGPMATRTNPLIPQQLLDQIERVRRRTHPFDATPELAGLTLDGILALIRAGRPDVLSALVRLAQDGDDDATAMVLWALYPLMATRLRNHRRRAQLLTEDYLTIGYLVLRDIDPNDHPLGHKIVSRTIRRALRPYERSGNDNISLDAALSAETGDDGTQTGRRSAQLAMLRSRPTDEVSERALSRLALAEAQRTIRQALEAGTISARSWELLLDARLGDQDPGALAASYGLTRGGARARIHRTTRRLRKFAA